MPDCQELRLKTWNQVGGRGDLPARQLGAALERLAARLDFEMNYCPHIEHHGYLGGQKTIAMSAGLGERQILRWRNGEMASVTEQMADLAMLGTGLFWWEVWNSATVRLPAIVAHTRRQRRNGKKLNSGNRQAKTVVRGKAFYGDLGTDWETLKQIELLWEPPMDPEAELWAMGA